jgi:hypothetical protein
MARLELDTRDSELLAGLLEDLRSDLRMEIAGTEDQPFRDELKHKEGLLDRLIAQLRKA